MSASNLEILAYEQTPLGPLCLRRRRLLSIPDTVVTEVTLDHEFLMSSLYTESERALAANALELHGGHGLRVLVGGLGLGYTAHAALASPRVAAVEVVEYLPEVIGWLERGLIPLAGELRDEPRLHVVEGDVYARLTGPADARFDLILVDVDHAPDDRLGDEDDAFYTAAGIARVSAHLAPGGVLGVWSADDSKPFVALLRNTFETVRVERVTHVNEMVDEESTDWLFFGVRARSLH